jgi:mRNA-degrading endonuclease RelE of RelBE toxin-antitoxin system
MGAVWTVKLAPQAQRQLSKLQAGPRESALDLIDELRHGDFPRETIPLEGHRNFERVKFYGRSHRMIYRINHKARTILILRIGKRDAKTYKGFNPA